jgi:hypothetical protein
MEALDEDDCSSDAGELEAASKVWTTAAGLIWSLLGTEPTHGTDRALIRVGLTDLAKLLTKGEQQTSEIAMLNEAIEGWRSHTAHTAKLEAQMLAREEQLTRRVAELEEANRGYRARAVEGDRMLADLEAKLAGQTQTSRRMDAPSLYIAGGSSERLTVGRLWIDRAIAEGARITYDWSRANGYEQERPSDTLRLGNAMVDVQAVIGAGVFWLLAPEAMSEGASTELGVAIASAALSRRIAGKERARIIVSGQWARRNLFALLADETYETHEQAWEAIRGRVTSGGTR